MLLVILLKHVRPYIVLSVSVFLIFCGIVLFMIATSNSENLMGVLLLGAGVSAGFPLILGYVGNLYTRLMGTAFSLVFVIALSGNILFNFLMGVIYHGYGIDRLPVTLMICLVCMAVMLVMALRKISDSTNI